MILYFMNGEFREKYPISSSVTCVNLYKSQIDSTVIMVKVNLTLYTGVKFCRSKHQNHFSLKHLQKIFHSVSPLFQAIHKVPFENTSILWQKWQIFSPRYKLWIPLQMGSRNQFHMLSSAFTESGLPSSLLGLNSSLRIFRLSSQTKKI